jgi:hypothetical protein
MCHLTGFTISDFRPSAIIVGSGCGVAVIITVVTLIILADLPDLRKHARMCRHNLRRRKKKKGKVRIERDDATKPEGDEVYGLAEVSI